MDNRITKGITLIETAIQDAPVPEELAKALRITEMYPETCLKISWWLDGLWELIAEFLNSGPAGVNDELFIQGCAYIDV